MLEIYAIKITARTTSAGRHTKAVEASDVMTLRFLCVDVARVIGLRYARNFRKWLKPDFGSGSQDVEFSANSSMSCQRHREDFLR